MTEVDGWMTCVAGGMGLSDAMVRMLSAYCDHEPLAEETRSTHTRWGGQWHCPLDGSKMSATDSLLPMCLECGRILPSNVIYQLIEVHDHR